MSLAVLPSSPVIYSQPSTSTTTVATPSKRPKLSLNTANLSPVVRKGATSLRLDTLSATSPTARNTFQNAWSPSQGPAVESSQQAPQPQSQPPTLPRLDTTTTSTTQRINSLASATSPSHSSTTSAASTSSSSTLDSLDCVPYKPSFNLRSILRNSPLPLSRTPRHHHQKRKLSLTAPQTPLLFPAAKRVSFRAPLTEMISTRRFTWRHSDLEVEQDERASTEEGGDGVVAVSEKSVDSQEMIEASSPSLSPSSAPQSTEPQRLRPIPADDNNEEEDADADPTSCPATPVAGRAKRVLQWRWTIDSSDGAAEDATVTSPFLDVREATEVL